MTSSPTHDVTVTSSMTSLSRKCGRWFSSLDPFFAVYLDDLSLEPSNIKAGYYVGEILLNHLTFVDDICAFCPSVRGLQRIPDVHQTDAGLHEIIFNCS